MPSPVKVLFANISFVILPLKMGRVANEPLPHPGAMRSNPFKVLLVLIDLVEEVLVLEDTRTSAAVTFFRTGHALCHHQFCFGNLHVFQLEFSVACYPEVVKRFH